MTVANQHAAAAAAATTADGASLQKILEDVLDNTQRANALNPLEGTLTDRLAYWNVTNPSWARAGLNGWDEVWKCVMACSMADGLKVHPALFMQGNWCFVASGNKLLVIPKVPFILALCRSRVPGFRMEIVADDAEVCEVKMFNGRESFSYRYTLEDAKRQGLIGRPKGSAWDNNQREMLQWKAVRRCADRACPEVMFGLSPAPEDSQSPEDEAPEDKAVPEMPTEVEDTTDYKELFRNEVRARWGTNSGKKMLEVANLIGAQNGWGAFTKADAITPKLAKMLVDFLHAKYGATGKPAEPETTGSKVPAETDGGRDAAAPREVAVTSTTATVTVVPFDEREPEREPDDDLPLDFGDPAPAQDGAPPDTDYRVLLKLVEVARSIPALAKVVFTDENPKRVVFVHGPTVKNLGMTKGIVIVKDGAQVVAPDLCARLVKAMRELGAVDAAPRT